MLPKLFSCVCFWSDGLDVLELCFVDASEDVFGPFFNQVHERTVTEGSVRAAIGEMIWLEVML